MFRFSPQYYKRTRRGGSKLRYASGDSLYLKNLIITKLAGNRNKRRASHNDMLHISVWSTLSKYFLVNTIKNWNLSVFFLVDKSISFSNQACEQGSVFGALHPMCLVDGISVIYFRISTNSTLTVFEQELFRLHPSRWVLESRIGIHLKIENSSFYYFVFIFPNIIFLLKFSMSRIPYYESAVISTTAKVASLTYCLWKHGSWTSKWFLVATWTTDIHMDSSCIKRLRIPCVQNLN